MQHLSLTLATASFGFALFVPTLRAQTPPLWAQQAPATSPVGLAWPSAAFDSARKQLVLFGGSTGGGISTVRGDTWTFDGSAWTRRTPKSSPTGVWAGGMCFDVFRLRTVSFGGQDRSGTFSNATWEWDGNDWTFVRPTQSPTPRLTKLVYDGARRKSVLFGGWSNAGSFADTWEYDGATWARVATSTAPSARSFHGFAHDGRRNRTILFGGLDPSGKNLGDTWEFDGTSWRRIATPIAPSARHYVQMCYDSARSRVVLFGGRHDSLNYLDDTWEFDGSSWTQVKTSTVPLARAGVALVYDGIRANSLLFGGYTSASAASTETWRYGSFTPALAADTTSVSLAAQGKQTLSLSAGVPNAQRLYFVLGSLSGTTPGIRLGQVTLPLQLDPYLDITASFPNSPLLANSLGTLDAGGRASAVFTAIPLLPPSLVGQRFHHAYVVFDASAPFVFTSNPVPLDLTR